MMWDVVAQRISFKIIKQRSETPTSWNFTTEDTETTEILLQYQRVSNHDVRVVYVLRLRPSILSSLREKLTKLTRRCGQNSRIHFGTRFISLYH